MAAFDHHDCPNSCIQTLETLGLLRYNNNFGHEKIIMEGQFEVQKISVGLLEVLVCLGLGDSLVDWWK